MEYWEVSGRDEKNDDSDFVDSDCSSMRICIFTTVIQNRYN